MTFNLLTLPRVGSGVGNYSWVSRWGKIEKLMRRMYIYIYIYIYIYPSFPHSPLHFRSQSQPRQRQSSCKYVESWETLCITSWFCDVASGVWRRERLQFSLTFPVQSLWSCFSNPLSYQLKQILGIREAIFIFVNFKLYVNFEIKRKCCLS
jgi:hypothetical protein